MSNGLHPARSPRCRASAYNTGTQRPFHLVSEQMDSDPVSPDITGQPLGWDP